MGVTPGLVDLESMPTTALPTSPARTVRPARFGLPLLLLLLLAAAGAAGASPRTPGPLTAPARPGEPAAGLEYFRLQPAVPDTVYRLLVIPVRFPEDAILGGGTRGEILARLNGEGTGSLNGYYRAATGGRMEVEATLAPTVVAEHPRTYYTVEGEGNFGYGTDPNAYPHNARRLVEEVTAALVERVDFLRFDNTGDGIADGLLLLHSGPESIEAPGTSPPPDHLAAHAFTLEAPVARSDAWVFPYAVAASRDAVGPWAHEMGHLLGLPDLYVSNTFCTGPGVGEWSLMATGANRANGTDPAGLDAYSRQLLGIPPAVAGGPGGDYSLAGGGAVRAYRFGAETGPAYFLVERRDGADGLGLDTPATVIYLVDETAGDNRSCPDPPEFYRPLVEVRGVVCPGTGACTVRLDDGSTPSLLGRDGAATGLVLDLDGTALTVSHAVDPPARLESVGLGPVHDPAGSAPERQAIRVVLRNLDPVNASTILLDVSRIGAGSLCPSLDAAVWRQVLAPGETRVDTTWYLRSCAGLPLPAETARYRFALSEEGSFFIHSDTLTLATRAVGLAYEAAAFTSLSLASGRPDPWARDGDTWAVAALGVLADGELQSPWFVVPAGGRVLLDHAWDLAAPSPDLALEGAQVRLHRQLAPDVLLTPPLGWGYTAARKSGNALAGTEVLSGRGERLHVLDVAAYAGEMVRLDLRVAADVGDLEGTWTVHGVSVRPAPPVSYRLAFGTTGPPGPNAWVSVFARRLAGGAPDAVALRLLAGARPVTPVRLVETAGDATGDVFLGYGNPETPRLELLWSLADGRADALGVIHPVAVPGGPNARILLVPGPNPVPRGQGQTWTVQVPESGPFGTYHLAVLDVRGRLAAERTLRFEAAGERHVAWNGRDDAGRVLRSGVYFLQVRRPDGRTQSRKFVVVP